VDTAGRARVRQRCWVSDSEVERLRRTGPWEPKRLGLRLFTIAATVTRHSRAVVLTPNQKHPWAALAHDAITALR